MDARSSTSSVALLLRALETVRARAKALLVARGVCDLAAIALGAVVVFAVSDYFLRTPSWLRSGVWVLGIVAIAWGLLRVIRPALRFRPTLTEVALKIESSQAGKDLGVRGLLASAIELDAEVGRPGRRYGEMTDRLSEPVIAQATSAVSRLRGAAILAPAQARQSIIHFVIGMVIAGGLIALEPGLSRIGASRVLAPWAGAQWPKRVELANITPQGVHPLGSAVPLKAALVRSQGNRDEARVVARYRVNAGGTTGAWQKAYLTGQDKTVVVPGAAENSARSGLLFERLVDPAIVTRTADGAARGPKEAELEYWFECGDDQTEPAVLKLVERPAVTAITLTVTPPPYAQKLFPSAPAAPLDLGAGVDERAAPPAILAGSSIAMRIELNKAVPTPANPAETARWIERALGPDAAALFTANKLLASFNENRWELGWTLAETARLILRPVDEHGLTAGDDATVRLEAAPDAAPSVVILDPETDRFLLPSAVVTVVGEARDDVALESLWLERRIARKPATSEGAPAAPVEEPVKIGTSATLVPGETPADQLRRVTAEAEVALSELGVAPGDEVWLHAVAVDAYELAGARHAPARSAPRRLVIISTEQFMAQVWSELGGVRRSAIRISEEQARVEQRLQQAGTPQELDQAQKAQAALTERIARERQALDQVSRRIEANNLNDPTLDTLLDSAKKLLDDAAQQSAKAAEAAENAEKSASQGKNTEAEKNQAKAAQDEVSKAMDDLAAILDQGQDTWAVKRAVERLLNEQRALKERTSQAGKQTAGKPSSELTPDQRRALDELARDQEALAKRTEEAVRQMKDRVPDIKKNDEASAKAVEEAAKRAEKEQVPQKMKDAADKAQQNQTNSAQQQQESAIQSLQQMLDDISGAQKNRDEILKRYLSTIIEQLDRLIKDQTTELSRLAEARGGSGYKGLDGGMIRLNQNTLAALDQGAEGPRELAPVIELIGRAAEAQEAAIVALRAEPVVPDDAQTNEDLSLTRLKAAKAEAERLEKDAEERDAERKAAELKKAYREALTEQVEILNQTTELAGQEANRRTRALARQLGERQEALRKSMQELRDKTKELSEATMFEYAHRRLDSSMTTAAGQLNEGNANAEASRAEQSAARVLRSLITALDKPDAKNDFRDLPQDDQGGGGGGGGQQPLIPPAAQVRLLRALQQEAAELTKEGEQTPGSLDEAATLQNDLAGKAVEMLKKLQERNRPPEPGKKPE